MQHSDRQYYCVAWYFLWHADLFRCRVACNHHDEETTESDGNNIQDDIESQAVFRILKSNLLRYQVEPQHDLENRIEQYVGDGGSGP